ncbi:FAD-linked sulfhydryl oxidase ALR [Galendromus occidentalis]|uniref:Sulfhydryl oxidase n=1 Tax=Galendromus occidentalis TaxID=34638 RepID=A0AAJ6QYH4_9ACAR|nr:FAD-linked sulfhydryl oxidase ALR [Galendromus occidentalis]
MEYGDYESRTRHSPRSRTPPHDGDAPCRACTNFKSLLKSKSGKATAVPKDCPLDRDQLGQHTWSFLHTVAAYFPKKPSLEQQAGMKTFLDLLGKFYPCDHCAADFRTEMEQSPPKVSSREALSQWMCEQHNIVNRKLGKKEFDCTKVLERWLHGPEDGSCG